ncbi:MAG: hypothetical protein ACREF1_10165, partial [Acetobacteraceae bacterium]
KVSSSKYANIRIQPDDRVRISVSGGGGFGDPAQRDPALVAEDLREGYISAEGASRDYGFAASEPAGD